MGCRNLLSGRNSNHRLDTTVYKPLDSNTYVKNVQPQLRLRVECSEDGRMSYHARPHWEIRMSDGDLPWAESLGSVVNSVDMVCYYVMQWETWKMCSEEQCVMSSVCIACDNALHGSVQKGSRFEAQRADRSTVAASCACQPVAWVHAHGDCVQCLVGQI